MGCRRLRLEVAVLLLLGTISGCATKHGRVGSGSGLADYKPVLPQAGDYAILYLSDIKADYFRDRPRMVTASDRTKRRMEIECTAAQGKRCEFRVSYLTPHGRLVPAYTITVNYAENELDKRTTIHDMRGALIPRYKMLKGVLVPFHDSLAFGKDYIPANGSVVQELTGGLRAIIERTDSDPSDHLWCVSALVSPQGFSGYPYSQVQRWKSGDWLWYDYIHSSSPERQWGGEHRENIWEATVEKMGHRRPKLAPPDPHHP